MKNAYYARSISIYDTKTQLIDTSTINAAGFNVVDITKIEVQELYKTKGMTIFKDIICQCDALFFRCQLDGKIGAGVSKEIAWAKGFNIPVFELPHNIKERTATVQETRDYLKSVECKHQKNIKKD